LKSNTSFKPAVLLALLTLLCAPAFADQETGWLELEEGYEGKVIGAKVHKVETLEAKGSTRITLSIPKDAIKTTEEIEEIVVVGKAPDKKAKPSKLNIHYEWASDYENDYYGLIITFGDATNIPIRLYLKGHTETP